MKNYYDNEDFFTAYSRMSRSQKGLSGAGEWEQLQPLFPDLREKTILDLGCGYGWHCNYAAEQGAAEVLGIDLSEKMIAEAQKRHSRKNIHYEVGSITDYAYPPETFDLVFSNLALHYIADLDDIYAKVWQTLKPGGVFLFNMEHPTFTAGRNGCGMKRGKQNTGLWTIISIPVSGRRFFWAKPSPRSITP